MKLGKKLGVVHDPRTFKLEAFIPTLPVAPVESYVGKGEEVRMYGNDRYGDCTCAAQAHRIDVQERSARQAEIQMTTEDVLEVYSAVTGFDPDRPETDNGAYVLDILNYMRREGMGREADGSRHQIGAFAKVDVRSPALWKVGSWMFGGIYFGAGLPLSARDQMAKGDRYWRLDESGYAGRGEFGSWGGHAMHSVGYSAGSIVLTTWDQRRRATWEWVEAYVDEAYVVISEDLLRGSGRTPQGFDVQKLTDSLNSLD